MITSPYLSLLVLITCTHVTSASCPAIFTQEHHALHNHVISSSAAESIDQCQQQCASHVECRSINFYSSQSRCELNKATHLSNPIDLTYEILGTYSSYDQLYSIDTCSDSLCSTDQICFLNKNDGEKEYICKVCAKALGMESKAIPNSAITASSTWDVGHESWQGRLNNPLQMPNRGAWIVKTNQVGEYLQVDLGQVIFVTMVATQGRPSYPPGQYVTEYRLAYKQITSSSWVDYSQGKTFVGNSDMETVVKHRLREKFKAQFVRFIVLKWNNHISMRAEIYGCLATN